MRDPVLIDTGPLVACFNIHDDKHSHCLEKFKTLKGHLLITSVAIVTETLYLLDFSLNNQTAFLRWMSTGMIKVATMEPEDFKKIADLMQKYHDCPMDFGDATLVFLADKVRTKRIFTLDHKDFSIYRTLKNQKFEEI